MDNNQWLFAMTKPTQLSIVCQQQNKNEEHVLKEIGILELLPGCKVYTKETILEAMTLVDTQNNTNIIPFTNILNDDCCRNLKKNLTMCNIKLQPIKLTNLDLNEMEYARHKLNEFDEQLQKKINQPFYIRQSS